MNIEELEIKLKISENTGIHCPTLELAKQILNIFNDLGLKWCTNVSYIKCINWDNYENNTVYYPTAGTFSSLQFAQEEGYKIISAEEFITLHTEEFNLENYEPKGELEGFPKEIIAKMLDYQQKQGNKKDVTVFENNANANKDRGGFSWASTYEGFYFWNHVINIKNFDLFFEKYPKKEDNQEFRVEDKVYDIILGEVGIVKEVNTNDILVFGIKVVFENYGTAFYTPEGKSLSIDKYPRLLHYIDNFNYDVIDFNNLPKRQEPKRWRAEKGETYYIITSNFEIENYCEENEVIDDEAYNSGNYFQTKEQAQEVADKLKEYFKQLIKEEHEHEKNRI